MKRLVLLIGVVACNGSPGESFHAIATEQPFLTAEQCRYLPAPRDPETDAALDVHQWLECSNASAFADAAFSVDLVGHRVGNEVTFCRIRIAPFLAQQPGGLHLEELASRLTDRTVADALRALATRTSKHRRWNLSQRSGPAWIAYRQDPGIPWISLDVDACVSRDGEPADQLDPAT